MQTVSSIAELISRLGGPTKAAEVLSATSPQQVVNWRLRDKISPELFVKHQAILSERGIKAPPSFWAQAPKQESAA